MIKKSKFLLMLLIIAFCISVPSFAFLHSDDEFDYGAVPGWYVQYQYSNFYCSVQNHHATAVIVDVNGLRHEVRDDEGPGIWAKAKTDWYEADQWNSYYGHD